jgi:hypothetical protein
MFDTILYVFWYIFIILFFFYKYTSIILQFKGFIVFSFKCVSWVGLFFSKTFSFISIHNETLEPLLIPKVSRLHTFWIKTKRFFGFTTESHQEPFIPFTNVSNSHIFSSQHASSTIPQQTGYLPLDKLLYQQSLHDSTELYEPLYELPSSQYYSSRDNTQLDTIIEDDSDCEPIHVHSYHDKSLYHSISLS